MKSGICRILALFVVLCAAFFFSGAGVRRGRDRGRDSRFVYKRHSYPTFKLESQIFESRGDEKGIAG